MPSLASPSSLLLSVCPAACDDRDLGTVCRQIFPTPCIPADYGESTRWRSGDSSYGLCYMSLRFATNAHHGCLLQVIFLFGEIDCREGLTMAVDKLKYETLEAAMQVLLQIYQGRAACLFWQHSYSTWHSPKCCSVLQTFCWT